MFLELFNDIKNILFEKILPPPPFFYQIFENLFPREIALEGNFIC